MIYCSSNSSKLVMWILVHAILNLFTLAFNLIVVSHIVFWFDSKESEYEDSHVVILLLLSAVDSTGLHQLHDGLNEQRTFKSSKSAIDEFWVFNFKYLHIESSDGPQHDFIAVVAKTSLVFLLLLTTFLNRGWHKIAKTSLIACVANRFAPLFASWSWSNWCCNSINFV